MPLAFFFKTLLPLPHSWYLAGHQQNAPKTLFLEGLDFLTITRTRMAVFFVDMFSHAADYHRGLIKANC